jgi:CBS domain-containing protein
MKLADDFYNQMIEVYDLQMQLRVIHQLGQIENGEEPDDFIYPDQLTDLEKRMLKDGFSVIDTLQQLLRKEIQEL